MKKLNILYSCALSIVVCFSAQAQQKNALEKYHNNSQDSYQESYQENHQKNFQESDPQYNLQQAFSDAELAQMLAPIALYPDSLLTHILIASTYPLEIVEAHRWLKKNDSLNAKQIGKAIEDFDWDASVKALVPFEQILSRLSDDLSWMQQLGDAFLHDESRVLSSIQTLRYEAKHAGNLNKMANMEVSYDDDNIIIEPIKRDVVYVPYYDTRMVYGSWRWSLFPPIYWAPHHRVYVNHHNPFYWHSGIRISFNYFFSTFHWHKRHVVVINPKRTHHYRARKLITHGGYAKPWLHKPMHRRGVAYKNKIVGEKYRGSAMKYNKHVKNSRSIKPSAHTKEYKATHASLSVPKHTPQQYKKHDASFSPSVTQRKVKQYARQSATNTLVAKSSQTVIQKRSNQEVEKRQPQASISQTNRKALSNAKSVNRSKERYSKERYSKERH